MITKLSCFLRFLLQTPTAKLGGGEDECVTCQM